MKTFNKYINTYLTHFNKTNRFKKGYEIDGNIVLTNKYSIVVLSFSAKQIRNIQKIIDGNGAFLSENNEQAISLTGKNGFAFLLGMRCY